MKKIICLILCCAMLSTIPAYAVKESPESIYVEETTTDVYVEEPYEEPEPELCELNLYCNDLELKINTIPYKYAAYSANNYKEQSYQYITIANALGYETTYNEETAEITSLRADRTIKIVVGSDNASVIENDETTDVYMFATPFTFQGRTFITKYDLERIFNVEVYISDYNSEDEADIPYVNIYEYKHFYDIFKSEFDEYNSILDLIFALPNNNTSETAKIEYKLDFKSDLLGTTVKGSGKTELFAENGNDYGYFKLKSSTDGIFNLWKLNAYKYDLYYLYDNKKTKENIKIDFNNPDEFETYFTPQNIYVKSNDIINYRLGITENTKEKWIKLPDMMTGGVLLPDNESEEVSEMIKDFVIEKVVEGFVNGNLHLSYKEIYGKISELSSMFDKKIINYNEKNKTLKINCSAEEFKKITVLFGAPAELAEWFSFSVNTTDTFYDNSNNKGNGNVNYSLSNLPNPYGADIGTVKFEMKFSYETNTVKTPKIMPKPEEIINMNEIIANEL